MIMESKLCTILSITYCFIKCSIVSKVNNYCTVYDYAHNIIGIVFSICEIDISVLLFVSPHTLCIGQTLIIGNIYTLSFSEDYFGTMISPCGEVLLGNKIIQSNIIEIPIFDESLSIVERGDVKTPFITGINAIDVLFPCGKGQRLLILGDRKTGKTSLAMSIINHQLNCNKYFNNNVISIYVFIGTRSSDIVRCFYKLNNSNCIFISASSSSYLGMQFLAPMVGAAISEYYAKKNMNVLLIFDDLSKHAIAYREISVMNRILVGRDSYPGDIFYIHASLLEKGAQYSTGGSITIIPIVETIDEEISDYIPTNIISITDGQIVLSKLLFNLDIKPAIDLYASVSRIGSYAQIGFIKRMISKCLWYCSKYNDIEKFSLVLRKSDFSSDVLDIVKYGKIWKSVFIQDFMSTCDIGFQCILFYVINNKLISYCISDDEIFDIMLYDLNVKIFSFISQIFDIFIAENDYTLIIEKIIHESNEYIDIFCNIIYCIINKICKV